MPDRATIDAATPKCVKVLREPMGKVCGHALRYRFVTDWWTCPTHGNVTTPQSLVARQTPFPEHLRGPG